MSIESETRDAGAPGRRYDRRLLPLGIAAVGLAVYFFLAPKAPADQAVRLILGDAAPRVVEVDVRYVAPGPDPDLTRAVTFRYAPGAAPRIVSHEPRLANGDYVVQMEFGLTPASAPGLSPPDSPLRRLTVDRTVTLRGGSTSIDVSRDLARRDGAGQTDDHEAR